MGEILRLYFTYAIIQVFGGEEIRLYRDSIFFKIIMKEGSNNSPIYNQEKDYFSCFMLQEHEEIIEDTQV